MSWQAYIDSNLVGSGKIDKASIFGLDGSLWATSPSFQIGAAEVKALIAGFDDPALLSSGGVFLEGEKYVYLRSVDSAIYARKGSSGVCCARTTQAIIVGHYNENMQGGDANTVVEGLAAYLVGVGY